MFQDFLIFFWAGHIFSGPISKTTTVPRDEALHSSTIPPSTLFFSVGVWINVSKMHPLLMFVSEGLQISKKKVISFHLPYLALFGWLQVYPGNSEGRTVWCTYSAATRCDGMPNWKKKCLSARQPLESHSCLAACLDATVTSHNWIETCLVHKLLKPTSNNAPEKFLLLASRE